MLGVKYFEGLRSVEHDPWYLLRERLAIAINSDHVQYTLDNEMCGFMPSHSLPY